MSTSALLTSLTIHNAGDDPVSRILMAGPRAYGRPSCDPEAEFAGEFRTAFLEVVLALSKIGDLVRPNERQFRQDRIVPGRMAQGRFGVLGLRWHGRGCTR